MNSMGIPKNLSDFLIEISKEKTLAEIAKAIGVSDSYLSKLRAGHYRAAGLDIIVDLSLYTGKPIDWMLKLIGKESYYPKLKRCMAREFQKDPIIQLNIPDGEFEGIKCLDSPVCLGPGSNMDEAQVMGFLPIHKSELPVGYKSEPDRIVCFPTEGRSMVPTIMPGSHIVIDRFVPAEWVTPGGIYAFLLSSGDVTIKRLIKLMDGSILIDADNQDPKERTDGSAKDFPMVLPLREDHSIIRGRVIWIFNRLVEEPKQ